MRVLVDFDFGKMRAAIVRAGDENGLCVVVGDVDIVAAYQQNIFVHAGIGAIGNRNLPGLAEVGGFGEGNVTLAVLQPGSVDGFSIQRINYDLRIHLLASRRSDHTWRRPGRAAVAADGEDSGGAGAARAAWHAAILRIEDINVPIAIGGDGRLPLVASSEPDAGLRRKTGNGQGSEQKTTGEEESGVTDHGFLLNREGGLKPRPKS